MTGSTQPKGGCLPHSIELQTYKAILPQPLSRRTMFTLVTGFKFFYQFYRFIDSPGH